MDYRLFATDGLSRKKNARLRHREANSSTVLLALFLFIPGLSWSANIIVDPSFEGSTLAAYYQSVWTGSASIGLSTSEVHSGAQSLQVQGQNASATIWQVHEVSPGTDCRASVWINTEGLSGAGKTGLEVKSNGEFYYISSDQQPNDGQWHRISIDFNTGTATELTVICAFEMYGDGTGTAWFDDFALETVEIPSTQFSLTFGEHSNGKQGFFLNGEEFNPVVLTKGLPAPSTSQIETYRQDGFNLLYLSLNADTAGNAEVGTYLSRCRTMEMPVIVEYEPGFWRNNWLASNPARNMQLSPKYPGGATYVQYFPDYLNQYVLDLVQSETSTIVNAIAPYHHRPVVAYSIGAYDFYHLPDGEVHILFTTVYPHPLGEGNQTWVPYGAHVTHDFQDFLGARGAEPKALGFTAISEVMTPTDRPSAKNENHWNWWIRYRRYYVRQFTLRVTDGFRDSSGLPVTGTFDINFSLNDNFATPIEEVSDLLDFFILYYYDGSGIR